MKAELTKMVSFLAMILVVSSVALAQAPQQPQMPMGPGQGMSAGPMGPGMMEGGMGPGMMGQGMGPGMMGRGPMGPGGRRADPEDKPLISIMLQLRQQLGLSAEQVSKLRAMRSEFEKEAIRVGAEIRVIEVDLDDLLEQEKVDLGKVEAAIRKEETLRGNLRISRIKTIESSKALITVEQRDKLKKALEAGPGMGMMGQGMMGPGQPMGGGPMGMGMMGPGGQGQGMMMGPQMMQQMMGGGMGQQAAAAPSASPTGQAGGKRTDATGPVTVEATLLDPGKASDRIRIEIVLDTHSVELDGYKLESLATLRTDTGKVVQPLAIESPSGSGHHRKGILVFPGTDASGSLLAGAKTVELIVRDVGGVKERTLRWMLP